MMPLPKTKVDTITPPVRSVVRGGWSLAVDAAGLTWGVWQGGPLKLAPTQPERKPNR